MYGAHAAITPMNVTRGTLNQTHPVLTHGINNILQELTLKQAHHDTHSFLGETGIRVSKICLGSITFGELDKKFGDRPGQLSEQEAYKILDKYVELGGNFIDTADVFPWFGKSVGEAETIIGNWLTKHKREKIILMTKARLPTDFSDVNAVGLSRNHLFSAVEHSLKRLKTHYIDVFQIHGWDESTNIIDTLRTLNDLVRQGKIRHIGCVDLKAWQVQTVQDYAKMWNMESFVCMSTEYNLLTRGPELELTDMCRVRHMSLLPYSPLKGGYLTGQYKEPGFVKPKDNTRIAAASKDKSNLAAMAVPFDEMKPNHGYWNTLEVCQKIATKHNRSVPQVALRWLIQKDVVCSVIIGVTSVEQLEENMEALKFKLSQEDMAELDKVSEIAWPSPYYMDTMMKSGRARVFFTNKDLPEGASVENQMFSIASHKLALD